MQAERDPVAFYLPPGLPLGLADAWAEVESVRLPLHSQLLATQASVLRDVFVTREEGGGGEQVWAGGAGGGALFGRRDCPSSASVAVSLLVSLGRQPRAREGSIRKIRQRQRQN